MFEKILSDKERQKWIKDLIIPTFTNNKIPSEKPTFVLLTGQSGSGKSYSSMQYSQKFLENTPVRFGTDDIRILHPKAKEILLNDEANYTFLTKKDAGLARTALLDYSFDKGYNILVESILLSPDDYKMQTLLQAREKGYQIECVALGVHRNLSEVSIFSRQEEQKKMSGVGFPATLGVHNEAYELLPKILCDMHTFKTVDKISIYNRKFECFYDSDKTQGDEIMIRKCLMEARNSSLNPEEMTDVALKWENVIKYMDNRQASPQEKEIVSELYHNFLKKTGLVISPQLRNFKNTQNQK